MNINKSDYANRDQQEGTDTSPGERRAQRGWPPLSRSELETLLNILKALSDAGKQERDRGDGDER